MWIVNSLFGISLVLIYIFVGAIMAFMLSDESNNAVSTMFLIILWPFAVVVLIGITVFLSIDKFITTIIHKLRRK